MNSCSYQLLASQRKCITFIFQFLMIIVFPCGGGGQNHLDGTFSLPPGKAIWVRKTSGHCKKKYWGVYVWLCMQNRLAEGTQFHDTSHFRRTAGLQRVVRFWVSPCHPSILLHFQKLGCEGMLSLRKTGVSVSGVDEKLGDNPTNIARGGGAPSPRSPART